MAKSLRSKWKRKMRAIKSVRYGVKEKVMLDKMVEQTLAREEVEVKTVKDIKEDAVMETETKSEFNPKTMLNKDGNYPKWMNKNKIKKIKKTNSEKKKGTKEKKAEDKLSKSLPAPKTQENSDSGIEEDKKNKTLSAVPSTNAPFRRVKAEEIEVKAKFADNRHQAGFDEWGAKASQDLIVTRGKSFRHEKTKKKRGSYRGGPINVGVNSIKFDSD